MSLPIPDFAAELLSYRRDIGTPHVIRLRDRNVSQQIWKDEMLRMATARRFPSIQCFDSHDAHQPRYVATANAIVL